MVKHLGKNITTNTPITEPVTAAAAKVWAKVDYTLSVEEETEFSDMLTASREQIESELSLQLVPSAVVIWVESTKNNDRIFQLPYSFSHTQVSNLVVSEMEDGEADEVLTLNDDYYFNADLALGGAGRYKIAYTVTPIVPTTLKEAIKMLVAYRYNNKGDQHKQEQQGLPEDIERKIAKYRQIWL